LFFCGSAASCYAAKQTTLANTTCTSLCRFTLLLISCSWGWLQVLALALALGPVQTAC
jgi:hypothetical protein